MMGKRKWIAIVLLLLLDGLLLIRLVNLQHKAVPTASITENQVGSMEKRIAITFDDGPNDTYTRPLLEGLRQRNVKATFFLLGNEVVENPDIAKEIAREGHLIGNHSFYHVNLREMSTQEAVFQVSRTNEVIYEVTGQYPQLIRPPFGKAPEGLIYEPPMIEVLWTIDSRDWELDDVGTILQNVLPSAKEDAIILMHDASHSSVQAALEIIDSLSREGYSFVTLDEILFR